MSKVSIIRSVIAAAAILSLMAVAPGPALAGKNKQVQKCKIAGSGDNNTLTCEQNTTKEGDDGDGDGDGDTINKHAVVVVNNIQVLTDNQLGDIDALILKVLNGDNTNVAVEIAKDVELALLSYFLNNNILFGDINVDVNVGCLTCSKK